MKAILIVLAGIFSFLYLLNPSAGIFEFIPDNLPLVGNLDEATATALLLSTLAYFGIDFGHLFNKGQERKGDIKEAEIEDDNK